MRNWSSGRAPLSRLEDDPFGLLACHRYRGARFAAGCASWGPHARGPRRKRSARQSQEEEKKASRRAGRLKFQRAARALASMRTTKTSTVPSRHRPSQRTASSKADDEGQAGSQKAAADDDAEERPAPKKPKRAPAADKASAAESSDQPAATAEKKAEEAPASAAPAPSALEVGLAPMALFRRLSFTSDAAAAGRGNYSLSPGAEAGLWLEVYPAAFSMSGLAANIGVFGHYAHGFGTTSSTPGNGSVATAYQDFLGGVKLRFPLGHADAEREPRLWPAVVPVERDERGGHSGGELRLHPGRRWDAHSIHRRRLGGRWNRGPLRLGGGIGRSPRRPNGRRRRRLVSISARRWGCGWPARYHCAQGSTSVSTASPSIRGRAPRRSRAR